MVVVDVGIALGADREIEEPMLGEQVQHVIEKGNGGVYPPSAGPLQGQGDPDLTLGRVALHDCLALAACMQRPQGGPGVGGVTLFYRLHFSRTSTDWACASKPSIWANRIT